MIKQLSALSLALGFVASAQAGKLKVSLEQTNEFIESSYLRASPSDEWYTLATDERVVTSVTRGEGALAGMNKDKTVNRSEVIGKDLPGHDLIKFELAADGKIYMTHDLESQATTSDGITAPVGNVLRIPVTFKNGTWNDYLAGKTVQIETDKKSTKQAMDAFSDAVKNAMASVMDAFKAKGVDVSNLSVESGKETNGDAELNLTSYTKKGGSLSATVSFKVKM